MVRRGVRGRGRRSSRRCRLDGCCVAVVLYIYFMGWLALLASTFAEVSHRLFTLTLRFSRGEGWGRPG